MKYPRIASRLYAEPWMMFPARYQEMCAGFESARTAPDSMAADDPVGPEVEDFWTGEKRRVHPQIELHHGLALAHVQGVTGKGLSQMAMQCGGFDTGLFTQQLENIAEDPKAKALVINFDTPGGMAAGNAQVGTAIRAVSDSGKRVYGWCGPTGSDSRNSSGLCCSAGYWMAAACDEFHAEADSMIGSISTIYAGVDSSKNWEQEGYELKLFATGKFKATGMPGKQWTQEEEDYIWTRIRGIDAEFKGFVSARRGVEPENMEGQWWYAKHAPKSLVDSTSFRNLSQLLESVYATL